jgi:hypothetical protein
MNTPLDRDAIARRVFDEAICCPSCEPIHALGDWLRLIAGLGGFASHGSDAHLEEEMNSVLDAMERAAKIATALSDAVEGELLRLSNAANGNGGAA